jgi:hypothetical protein
MNYQTTIQAAIAGALALALRGIRRPGTERAATPQPGQENATVRWAARTIAHREAAGAGQRQDRQGPDGGKYVNKGECDKMGGKSHHRRPERRHAFDRGRVGNSPGRSFAAGIPCPSHGGRHRAAKSARPAPEVRAALAFRLEVHSENYSPTAARRLLRSRICAPTTDIAARRRHVADRLTRSTARISRSSSALPTGSSPPCLRALVLERCRRPSFQRPAAFAVHRGGASRMSRRVEAIQDAPVASSRSRTSRRTCARRRDDSRVGVRRRGRASQP